jgi:hypothetical protein
MINKITFFVIFSLSATAVMAQQWSKSDSLNLNRLLKGNKEININEKERINIQFDTKRLNKPYDTPIQQSERIRADETLPGPKKRSISLLPYKPTTPYNWDPIFNCKIVQVNNHWEPLLATRSMIEQARATDMAQSVTGLITKEMPELRGIELGHSGIYIKGNSISGLDLMLFFERKFWDKAGAKRRATTLDLLKHYNDPLYKKEKE